MQLRNGTVRNVPWVAKKIPQSETHHGGNPATSLGSTVVVRSLGKAEVESPNLSPGSASHWGDE